MHPRDISDLNASLLRLADQIAREMGLPIKHAVNRADFSARLSELVRRQTDSSIRLYGFRAQHMFAYVIAALGEVAVITEEDQGIFFDSSGLLTRPDFRIQTKKGSQILVEVKNFRASSIDDCFVIGEKYLERLANYSSTVGIPLKIAVYWVGWNCWTLIDPSRLSLEGRKFRLSIMEAMKINEMGLLGDVHVGTEVPLVMRLHADLTKPRSIDLHGLAPFTIGRVTLHVGGKEITNQLEIKIAALLIFFGKWGDVKTPVAVSGGLVDHFDFIVQPEIISEGQGFELVGSMSQIVSNQYLYSTSEKEGVTSLAPKSDVKEFGVLIPDSYQGQVLKLWRFQQMPNTFEGEESES
ncbi:hypothetical protein OJ996_15440 [Luteolibacter sp. GHJ8]|uniref:Restriction endonuclease n=1 Tax=Luteolibacter rhizosphaerae TaxID=2989719 RepID=A0ABT3G562_9BACT|nr:hypothetical protein [Luteolibacter rhizosphaerae]MCW1914981.1 hypothetical protein [Luteolibacter rhizosphaerae]